MRITQSLKTTSRCRKPSRLSRQEPACWPRVFEGDSLSSSQARMRKCKDWDASRGRLWVRATKATSTAVGYLSRLLGLYRWGMLLIRVQMWLISYTCRLMVSDCLNFLTQRQAGTHLSITPQMSPASFSSPCPQIRMHSFNNELQKQRQASSIDQSLYFDFSSYQLQWGQPYSYRLWLCSYSWQLWDSRDRQSDNMGLLASIFYRNRADEEVNLSLRAISCRVSSPKLAHLALYITKAYLASSATHSLTSCPSIRQSWSPCLRIKRATRSSIASRSQVGLQAGSFDLNPYTCFRWAFSQWRIDFFMGSDWEHGRLWSWVNRELTAGQSRLDRWLRMDQMSILAQACWGRVYQEAGSMGSQLLQFFIQNKQKGPPINYPIVQKTLLVHPCPAPKTSFHYILP